MRNAMLRTISVALLTSLVAGSASAGGWWDAKPDSWVPPEAAQYANRPCRDPWVSYGVILVSAGTTEAQGRGESGECNVKLYNNGSWRSFKELLGYIEQTRNAMWRRGAGFRVVNDGVVISYQGQQFGKVDFSGKPMGIVAAGGGNIVAAGGGNIVAAGGGNILVIAPGGQMAWRGDDPSIVDTIELAGGMKMILRKDVGEDGEDDEDNEK